MVEVIVSERKSIVSSVTRLASVVYEVKYDQKDYDAFLKYYAKATSLKVSKTCLIPIFAVSLLNIFTIMIFPLRPVSEGFTANATLPITSFVGPTAGLTCFVAILQHFFPEYTIPRRHICLIAVAGGASYVATLLILTRYCFPFPLATIVPLNVATPVSLLVANTLVFKKLEHLPYFKQNLSAYVQCMITAWSMMLIYPFSIKLYYDGVSYIKDNDDSYLSTFQIGTALFLFIVRRTLKKRIIRICEKRLVPAPFLAVVGADAFHVVYVSIVLQQGTAWYVLAAIMSFDTTSNFFALRRIFKIRDSCEKNFLWTESDALSPKEVQVRRKLLQFCENFVLIEYVECIIPAILAIFSMYFYFNDTNRKYFKSYEGIDSYEKFVSSQQTLWIYALMEVLCLIVFRFVFEMMMTKKTTDEQQHIPFYKLLGFVLERQMQPMLAILCCWTLYANAASVKHMGSDWSLECHSPAP